MHIETSNSAFAAPPKPTGQTSGPVPSRHPSFWSEFISHAAEAAGIDPHLALQVAMRESDLNPHALNPSSGAIGIMQLMPATAAELGVDPHNVAQNIRGGIHYLHQQLAKFGSTAQALAAYNWGPGHVAHAVARWGSDWLNHAPSETRHYVASILARAGIPMEPVGNGTVLAANSPTTAPAAVAAQEHQVTLSERARMKEAVEAYLLAKVLG
ncbi:MAG: lytic transglycosylase domain-containing protein [Terriglobia bacterium]